VLGNYERVPLRIVFKNIIAWFALSLNNSYSTFAALFKKTTQFEITHKGINATKSRNQIPIQALILTVIMFALFFFRSANSIFRLSYVSVTTLLLGAISSTTVILSIRNRG
jgi:hypothetical protein